MYNTQYSQIKVNFQSQSNPCLVSNNNNNNNLYENKANKEKKAFIFNNPRTILSKNMSQINPKNITNNKSRLSLKTLPFFLSSSNTNDQNKSMKRFREQNDVVGLGIVVALNTNNINNTQNPVFAVSPRSDPIPIFSKRDVMEEEGVEIEMLEEYTCVITHVGNNMVKKREYFDDGVKRRTRVSDWVGGCGGGGVFCSPSPPVVYGGGGEVVFDDVEFLSCCNLCKKKLHGLDIFMYRGEKAFCSEECRYQQISIDERKEKYASRMKKQPEYVETLCCSPMQLPAGMAAA